MPHPDVKIRTVSKRDHNHGVISYRICRFGNCSRMLCRHNVVIGGWYRWGCRCGWSKVTRKLWYPDMMYKVHMPVKEGDMRKRKRSHK